MDFAATPPREPPPVILPGPPPERQIKRWRWWIHLVVIGSYPLMLGLLSVIIGKGQGPALSGNPKWLLIVCARELLMFGGIFLVGWIASRASRDDLLLRWRPGWWVFPLGIGYSLGLRLAVGVVMMLLGAILIATQVVTPDGLQSFVRDNQPEIKEVVDVSAMQNNPVYFWLTITVVSFLMGGLREEFWRAGLLAGLRVLWPRWFGSRGGQILGVGLAAIIFGIGHLYMGGLAVFMTAIIGFLLGLIMVLHRSIWPAAIAHGAFNATTMALLPWVEKLQGGGLH